MNTMRLGAHVVDGGVEFAVWAPNASVVEVQIDGARHALSPGAAGVHSGNVDGTGAGTRYQFVLDGGMPLPDPRSRFQPDGVHGPSEVIDPSTFAWDAADDGWPGLTMDNLVVYELHVGAFTPEGTFASLIAELPELARLGVTAIELMPVNEFPGKHNWGYDGVDWFAPSRAYGRPDDLRRLVQAAHAAGLGVLLDVVYNHFGPDGNYLRQFSDDYFTDRHRTPWGEGINYDGPNSSVVRDLVLDNVRMWIEEYRIDGFRFDASDTIRDESPVHIKAAITAAARAAARKPIVLIAEESSNDVGIFHPAQQGGAGMTGVWADDFHHEIRVLLTNARENYYANYEGSLAGIARTINEGFLYQGEPRPADGKPRGTKVTDEPAHAFVFAIQNHDQVGNRPFGERLHHDVEAGRYRVASALLLLAPETPLLFMGQEFAASTPFLFFTDHHEELGRLVTEGRRREFSGFRAFHDEAARDQIPDPQAESTFTASRLDLRERELPGHAGVYALYRELLRLRREDPVLLVRDRTRTNASVAGAHCLLLHRWSSDGHRLLVANFGSAITVDLTRSPSIAALTAQPWDTLLSTDHPGLGGIGRQASLASSTLTVPARTATLFAIDKR